MAQFDDYETRNYQDDLSIDDDQADLIMDEETDDPVEGFDVPVEEFKLELDKIDLEAGYFEGSEDARERIEDLDEDPEQESLAY